MCENIVVEEEFVDSCISNLTEDSFEKQNEEIWS